LSIKELIRDEEAANPSANDFADVDVEAVGKSLESETEAEAAEK
jgi:hypothetical protein